MASTPTSTGQEQSLIEDTGAQEQKSTGTKRPFYFSAGAVLAALVLAALAFVVGIRLLRPPTFHGILMQSSQPVDDFTLTASTGQAMSLTDLRGQYVVLYFGYTYCPDACPTTLSDLAQAMKILGQKSEQVQVLLITVDPERDTVEKLAEYVSFFHPSFLGMTGSDEEIAAAVTPFGILYERNEGTAASGYLVDHTATTTVVDDEGTIRLVWTYGTSPEEMAEDLANLMR